MALTKKLSGRPPAAVSQRDQFAGVRAAIWNIRVTKTVADQRLRVGGKDETGVQRPAEEPF